MTVEKVNVSAAAAGGPAAAAGAGVGTLGEVHSASVGMLELQREPKQRIAATKSTWTQQEDWQLTQLVGLYGAKNWSRIAQQLESRSGKQCRERWRNHLNPEVCKEPFSPEEDEIIIRMVEVHGTKWARIAKSLRGRTDNAVKNRYNSSLRKSHEKRRRKPRLIPSTPPDSPTHSDDTMADDSECPGPAAPAFNTTALAIHLANARYTESASPPPASSAVPTATTSAAIATTPSPAAAPPRKSVDTSFSAPPQPALPVWESFINHDRLDKTGPDTQQQHPSPTLPQPHSRPLEDGRGTKTSKRQAKTEVLMGGPSTVQPNIVELVLSAATALVEMRSHL